VLGYLDKRRVIDLAEEAGVTRGSVNRWLQWYQALGTDGLATGVSPGGIAPFPVELRIVAAAGWDPYATFFSGATVAVAGRRAATREGMFT
jgi:Helix-turn-helix domain